MPKLVTLSLDNNGIKALPPSLFADTLVANLSLAGNPLTKKKLLDSEGIEVFIERRKRAKDKAVRLRGWVGAWVVFLMASALDDVGPSLRMAAAAAAAASRAFVRHLLRGHVCLQ